MIYHLYMYDLLLTFIAPNALTSSVGGGGGRPPPRSAVAPGYS
jgi:hypothetical protein